MSFFFRQPSTIQDLVLRFPHVLEQIFQKLDNKSLFRCREVARSWQNIIDGRNYPWLRIVNIPRILKGRNTYLHLAARTGQIEPFKRALYEEENKNIKDQYGETFFHRACKYGRFNIVQLLLTDLELSAINNHRDVTTGATGATAVASKFSDNLTLSQPRGADSAHHHRGRS